MSRDRPRRRAVSHSRRRPLITLKARRALLQFGTERRGLAEMCRAARIGIELEIRGNAVFDACIARIERQESISMARPVEENRYSVSISSMGISMAERTELFKAAEMSVQAHAASHIARRPKVALSARAPTPKCRGHRRDWCKAGVHDGANHDRAGLPRSSAERAIRRFVGVESSSATRRNWRRPATPGSNQESPRVWRPHFPTTARAPRILRP